MNVITTHFIYALKKAWAEKNTSIMRLGQFLIVALILGLVFGSAFSQKNFETVKVAYGVAAGDEGARMYFEQLTSNDEITKLVSFTQVNSYEEGRAKVQKEGYGAFIYAPSGFDGQMVNKGEQAVLEVYSEKYSGLNYIVVSSILNSYNNGANASWAVQAINRQLDPAALSADPLNQKTVHKDNSATARTYYAVSMLLFMLLFGSEFGSFGIHEEYLGTMHMRSQLVPQRMWQMMLGKLSAYSLVVLTMAVLFVAITWLFFGLDWGPNPVLVLLICYIFGAFSIALGMVFMALTQDMSKTMTLIQVSTIGFTLLGGGFVATTFGGVEKISPNLYARDALLAVIRNEQPGLIWQNLGILGIATVVLVFIGGLASFRRKV